MKLLFPGVYKEGKYIFTKNAVPGKKVYGEKLIKENGAEYRLWDPTRSKLGAAILKDLKNNPFKKNSKILYLGASTGTTVSHVSDISSSGIIYAVEFAERVFRNLLELCSKRDNIAPIKSDARKPEEYYWIENVDVVFVDISQPDETEISIRNAEQFLKDGGFLIIAVKSQSIDVTKNPKTVFKEEAEKMRKAGFHVLETIDIQQYEKGHCIIVAKK
jgi:fibrillarin-like pre-rRNA processing protein